MLSFKIAHYAIKVPNMVLKFLQRSMVKNRENIVCFLDIQLDRLEKLFKYIQIRALIIMTI